MNSATVSPSLRPPEGSSAGPPLLRSKVLIAYLIVIGLVIAAGLVYLLLRKPIFYAGAVVGAPLAVLIMLHPRLALFQFVFCIFIESLVLPSVPVFLIDVSAVLVVGAATIDLLTSNSLPRRLPPMGFNYLYIFAAFLVCGFVGYFPHLLPIRLATLALLILTFFSLYRLLSYVRLTDVLGWFFWLAVAHSVYVLIPFVISAGFLRSFGFSGVLFDDMALVALPIGIALYLGAPRQQATSYLLGSTAVLGGLIATQSRLSIVFGLFFAAIVVILAIRRSRREAARQQSAVIRNRLGLIAIVGVLGLLALAALGNDLLQATIARFERLQNPFQQYSTVAYRLQLWGRAVTAFLDHPLFGLGPGGFYQMHTVYTTLHLTPNWWYLRVLGAHNVLLHYLSIAGLAGGLGLVALVVNQFRLSRRLWSRAHTGDWSLRLALLGWAITFAVTTFTEANWMWGQLSFLSIFLVALVAEQSSRDSRSAAQ